MRCPEIAAEWDYSKNAKTPNDFLAYSKDVVWWTSPQRPIWQQSIKTRTPHRLRDASQSAVPPVKRTLQSHVNGATSWNVIGTVEIVIMCRVWPRVLDTSCSQCVVSYMVLDICIGHFWKHVRLWKFWSLFFWHAFTFWRYALLSMISYVQLCYAITAPDFVSPSCCSEFSCVTCWECASEVGATNNAGNFFRWRTPVTTCMACQPRD